MNRLDNLLAPAKLNLFLHITGKRPDGYHNLESVFVFIDLADSISLELTQDGSIDRTGDIIGDVHRDLCVRAAQLLKETTGTTLGVRIHVTKRIPSGAGMGGGSSDAATTLLGLNTLWNLALTQNELINLGKQLGADVPFFLFGKNAFAQGIGEILSVVSVPTSPVLILMPEVGTNTAKLFSDPLLTRDSPSIDIAQFYKSVENDWPTLFGKNDMQFAAVHQNSQIKKGLNLLGKGARMTGSGSAVFRIFESEEVMQLFVNKYLLEIPSGFKIFQTKILQKHPLTK